jgi:hypothetical protein
MNLDTRQRCQDHSFAGIPRSWSQLAEMVYAAVRAAQSCGFPPRGGYGWVSKQRCSYGLDSHSMTFDVVSF